MTNMAGHGYMAGHEYMAHRFIPKQPKKGAVRADDRRLYI